MNNSPVLQTNMEGCQDAPGPQNNSQNIQPSHQAPPTTTGLPSILPSHTFSTARDEEIDTMLNSSSPIITDSYETYHHDTGPDIHMTGAFSPLFASQQVAEADVPLPSIEVSDLGGSEVVAEPTNSKVSGFTDSQNGLGLGFGLGLGIGLEWEQNANVQPEVERRPSFFHPAPAPMTSRPRVVDIELVKRDVESIAGGVRGISTALPQGGLEVGGDYPRPGNIFCSFVCYEFSCGYTGSQSRPSYHW